jgi:hypothetical protein
MPRFLLADIDREKSNEDKAGSLAASMLELTILLLLIHLLHLILWLDLAEVGRLSRLLMCARGWDFLVLSWCHLG